MGGFDSEKALGIIVALFLGFLCLPLPITLFWGSWAGVYDLLVGDITLLEYVVIFVAVFAVLVGIIGGYLGINSAKAGTGLGALAGIVALSVFLLYEIYNGGLSWAIDFTGVTGMLYMGLSVIFCLIMTGAWYIAGQYARD